MNTTNGDEPKLNAWSECTPTTGQTTPCECPAWIGKNAKYSALFLGMPVVEYIADHLMEKGKAAFNEDGGLTNETEREVWVLLTQALSHPALRAMFVSSLCRDAITEAAGHRWIEEMY